MLAYLRSIGAQLPITTSLIVVLVDAYSSMQLAKVVGFTRLVSPNYFEHFVPDMLAFPFAYVLFDRILVLARRKLNLTINSIIVLCSLMLMYLYDAYQYSIIVAPDLYPLYANPVPPELQFYIAAAPQMAYYIALPIVFFISLLRNMIVNGKSTGV